MRYTFPACFFLLRLMMALSARYSSPGSTNMHTTGIMMRVISRPNFAKDGISGLCLNFRIHLYTASMNTGMKTKTVIRLMTTPLARASPRSEPILNRIRQRARNPITVERKGT